MQSCHARRARTLATAEAAALPAAAAPPLPLPLSALMLAHLVADPAPVCVPVREGIGHETRNKFWDPLNLVRRRTA